MHPFLPFPIVLSGPEGQGPFDMVGDVHGCYAELTHLLQTLGYPLPTESEQRCLPHPEGRRLVFVGDLVDRGPDTPRVLRFVMQLCAGGQALCVPGNHDMQFLKMLQGHPVNLAHGLEVSKVQMEHTSPEFRSAVCAFLQGLGSHLVLDEGRLVVAHAGLPEVLHGQDSRAARSFCLYGATTGSTDAWGLPVRLDWAADYRGRAMVVYGHTPVQNPRWYHNTIDIDTGCVFGGKLTALRYPENELVSVPALRMYAVPRRPLPFDLAERFGTSVREDAR